MSKNKELIRESFILRNRIAHSSKKCKSDFIKFAKAKTSNAILPNGYNVGKFLTEKIPGNKRRIDIYFDAFLESAKTITP